MTEVKDCSCPCHDHNSKEFQSKCNACSGTGKIQN